MMHFKKLKPSKPLPFVLIGMLGGVLAGFFLLYPLDQTRGWNPYGWWFPATFIAAVAGGLAGVFLWGAANKKQPKRSPP